MQVSVIFALIVATFFAPQEIDGHGRMMDPINRSSIWRINSSFPKNFLDNELFCGGFDNQYFNHGGKCGVCGDDYAAEKPQPNQNTGTYGRGFVVKTYPKGSVITVGTEITANHIGYFQYSLCVLNSPDEIEEEECFKVLQFEDRSVQFPVLDSMYGMVYQKLVLPEDVTCERCVLRWHYQTGNRWGACPDGTGGMGCGKQEVFRSCSDISIV